MTTKVNHICIQNGYIDFKKKVQQEIRGSNGRLFPNVNPDFLSLFRFMNFQFDLYHKFGDGEFFHTKPGSCRVVVFVDLISVCGMLQE